MEQILELLCDLDITLRVARTFEINTPSAIFTPGPPRTIDIRLDQSDLADDIYLVILHELGHAAHDHDGSDIQESEAFRKVVEMEAWRWAIDHARPPIDEGALDRAGETSPLTSARVLPIL